jgi:hypothetical protein
MNIIFKNKFINISTVYVCVFKFSKRLEPEAKVSDHASGEESSSPASGCDDTSCPSSQSPSHSASVKPSEESSVETQRLQTEHNVQHSDSGAEDSGVVPGQFDSVSEESEGQGQGQATCAESEKGEGTAPAQSNVKKSVREWFADDVEKEWRKFNIDLSPRVSLFLSFWKLGMMKQCTQYQTFYLFF